MLNNTASTVMLEFCGVPLLLTHEEFEKARKAGAELLKAPATHQEAQQEAELITAKQLSAKLNLPTSTLYEGAKAGRLPCVRIGKHLRFNVQAVMAALDPRPLKHGPAVNSSPVRG